MLFDEKQTKKTVQINQIAWLKSLNAKINNVSMMKQDAEKVAKGQKQRATYSKKHQKEFNSLVVDEKNKPHKKDNR